MKNKLARFYVLASKIDPHYLQLAYFVFVLVGFVFLPTPADGGGGPH